MNAHAEGYTSDGPLEIQLTGHAASVSATITLFAATGGAEGPTEETIEEPGQPPAGELPHQLPKTGSGSLLATTFGGLALLAAGGLLAGRKRRRKNRHRPR